MPCKITAIFAQAQIGSVPANGWSENFYVPTDSLPTAIGLAHGYAVNRAPLSNTAVSIIATRATVVGNRGQSVLQYETGLNGTFATPDTPWNALWLRLTTVNSLHRQFLLRGMTDEFIVNEQWSPNTSWTTLYNVWTTYCIANGLSLIGRSRSNAILDLIGVDGAGLVTTVVPPAVAPGETWRFYRTKDTAGKSVLGNYRVVGTPAGNTFSVSPWQTGRLVTGGRITKIVNVPDTVNLFEIQGVRKRNVGRPFGQLRGRTKRRAA